MWILPETISGCKLMEGYVRKTQTGLRPQAAQ